MKKLLLIFCSLILISSCSVDPEIKPTILEDDIKEIIPPGWPTPFF